MFIGNSATGENSWVPTGGEPVPSEETGQAYFDHDDHSEFMESLNTTNNPDDVVEELKQARSKKLKKTAERAPARSRGSSKGEITQCVDSFTEVAKSLVGEEIHKSDRLTVSIKAAVDILNSTEGVEVGSRFWVNATEVLENETKRVLWLQMPEAARLNWMTMQVEKMA